MKSIQQIAGGLFLAVLIASTSCTKNFEEINEPWNQPSSASTPEMFNAVVSSLPLSGGEQSVLNAWIYPITQQAIVTSGSYAFINARGALWENYYLTLANVRVLEDRIAKSKDVASMNNVAGMLKTIMAYKSFKMTNYFGSMPFRDAGYAALAGEKGTSVYKAAYNTQEEIYSDILADLKWAVDNFSTDAAQYKLGTYDTMFKGDIGKWSRFANSLRLYIAVTVQDKNTTLATPHITEAMGKPLLAATENIGLWPSEIPNLAFNWREWSFSANCYLRLGTTMWNLMSSNSNTNGDGIFDPRVKIFYEPNNAGQWAPYPQNPTTATPAEGGTPYDKKRYTAWADKGPLNLFSPFNLYFEQDTKIPELMLTAAQIYFIKAEVYNRGLGVAASPANAKAAYEAGIKASVDMWKSIAYNSAVWVVNKPGSASATPAEINTLLSNPVVAYAADQPTALKQIYAQLWIDQFRQPWDAWTLQRRTGYMTPISSSNTAYYSNSFGIYKRMTFPDTERQYNGDNWRSGAGDNDKESIKLWIEK